MSVAYLRKWAPVAKSFYATPLTVPLDAAQPSTIAVVMVTGITLKHWRPVDSTVRLLTSLVSQRIHAQPFAAGSTHIASGVIVIAMMVARAIPILNVGQSLQV